MPVIRPIRELQNTTEISHFAKTLNEPIFITKNGRNDLVLMNDAVYERIMAQNEMYRKLAAAEAEVADGAELLDGMEVLKELRGKEFGSMPDEEPEWSETGARDYRAGKFSGKGEVPEGVAVEA